MGLPGQAVAPLALPDTRLTGSFPRLCGAYRGCKMTTARPDTWMPLYWGDYLRDTGHLSAAEHGAYLLLIGHYWTTGKPLPGDDVQLARIARMSPEEWERNKEIISLFFQKRDGLWHHQRISRELRKWKKLIKARSYAGKMGAKARATKVQQTSNKTSTRARALPSPSPSPSPSPLPSPSPEESGTSPIVEVLSSGDDAPKNSTRENAETMMAMWNELASRYPCLPVVRKLTTLRIRQAALRLSEIGGLEVWQGALEKIEISGHCLGNNDRGWTASFDFLLQPSSLTKLMEGNYDDRTAVSEKPENPYALAILEDRARRET